MADEDYDEDYEEASSPPTHYYANLISSIPGPFDLTIDFGCQVGQEDPEWLTRVSLSWEEARVLERFIGAAVRVYEQTMGPIRDIEGLDQPPGNGGISRQEDDEEDDEDED
jgi:hypothetical protein